MNHSLKMLLGCLLPLLVIFALPVVGVSDETAVFVFVVLMFGCHLFMMRGHGEHHHRPGHRPPQKGDPHASA